MADVAERMRAPNLAPKLWGTKSWQLCHPAHICMASPHKSVCLGTIKQYVDYDHAVANLV